MPHGIRKPKYSSLVLSRTRRLGYYQSGDAIIEEINKEAKRDVEECLMKLNGNVHLEIWTP